MLQSMGLQESDTTEHVCIVYFIFKFIETQC